MTKEIAMVGTAEQLQSLYGYVEFTDRDGRAVDLHGRPAEPDSAESRIIRNPDGTFAVPRGWEGNEGFVPPRFGDLDWYDGNAKRLLDLSISGRIYGIAVHVDSLTLQTHSGDIYFAGPFSIRQADGTRHDIDPADRDETLVAALDRLITNTIKIAALCPETSELAVSFDDGSQLDWKRPSDGQGMFRARSDDGRQFWSVGDGTVFWYGGTPGTHPHFFIGGPKQSD
jgi:hypothetical protein